MLYVPCSPLQPSEPVHVPSGLNTSTGSSGRGALSVLAPTICTARQVPATVWVEITCGVATVEAAACPAATGGCVGWFRDPASPKPATAIPATATAAAPETIQVRRWARR